MYAQPMLASWAADWRLLGAPVWFFLCLGIITALLASSLSPLSVSAKHRLMPWLPALMLLGCLFTRWINSRYASFLSYDYRYFYKFYFAYLDTSFVICIAFGVAFTIDSLRTKDRLCRIAGWIFFQFTQACLPYHSGISTHGMRFSWKQPNMETGITPRQIFI